jgi:hypothetical protein
MGSVNVVETLAEVMRWRGIAEHIRSDNEPEFIAQELRTRLEKMGTETLYAPCSRTPEESQVEGSEHQDNANIRCQPLPESVSEEHEIYTDYDGCHRHHVKHGSYLSAHFS